MGGEELAQQRARIGLIGVGRMGAPMARRLLAGGYPLTVTDLDTAAVAAIARAGASPAEDPAAVARAADVVITMLPDGPVVERVVYGPRGLAEAMTAGQLLLEMTSSRPAVTRKVAADLGTRGITVVDAPVSGGVRGAEAGTLCIMVGAPESALAACRPILACLGRDIVHVGDNPGDGDAAKTLNNMLSAMTMWSTAEALALGAKAGLAPERLIEAVNHSTGRSNTTEVKAPRYIIPRRFDAGFTVAQYLKDLDICLGLAAETRTPLPLASALHQLWAMAAGAGMAAADHTALVEWVQGWAGS